MTRRFRPYDILTRASVRELEDWMGTAIWRRRWALACALSLLLCVPLVKPWLGMGTIGDDASYTRSAQLLAQTGHIVYNGWATAMLGWQLYWAALFIKLFGFSFDVVRMSTLPVAMVAAFLSQRSMVRSGLTERNATLATLTLVLSPLYLPLTFSYMTDIGGYFVLVLCFYACLRVVEAENDAQACWWIAFAAVSNGIGGTIRQIGWLGLLVILPSTLWLVRARRRVLVCGVIFLILGLAIMLGAMQWYKHQPMAIAEPLWRGALTKELIRTIVRTMARALFDALGFVLPVLLAFIPGVRWRDWRTVVTFLAGCGAIWLGMMAIQRQPQAWLEPSIGDYVSQRGVLDGSGIDGARPVILSEGLRVALTALVIGGVTAMAVVLASEEGQRNRRPEALLSWSSLWVLIAPLSVAYISLLMSRAGVNMVFDRYLLLPVFILLLVIARCYQERVAVELPRYAFVLLAVVAIYAIGATHDAFAMMRARLAADQEIEARGVPDIEIDGGWEFNVWTVLQGSGALVPYDGDASVRPLPQNPELVCRPSFAANTPGLQPRYTLSYNRDGCGGPVGIPPVPYREWFGPREVSIYVVSSLRDATKPETKH